MNLLGQNEAQKSHIFMQRYVLIDEPNKIFHVIKEETVLSDEHVGVSETIRRLIDKINAREGIDGLIRNVGRPKAVGASTSMMGFCIKPLLMCKERSGI